MLATLLVQYYPDGSLVYSNPYLDNQISMGRQPFSYVEIDLDYCANSAGVAPCTAAQTGDAKCFNTYKTCNDTANFNLTTKTYRFCSPNSGKVPKGLDAIPCLRGISITPAEITAGKGLGLRAACSITLQDFPHSDIRIDPYVNERTYIPVNRGTFFGKLKARNPYYNGRVMRVYNGYLEQDGSYNIDNFEKRTFIIEQWDGIDTNGLTKITSKDVLKLASDERAVCPKASIGKLNLDLTDSATTCTLTPSGVGADYPASGYIRIGQEVCSFTRSSDTFTITRGQKNTQAKTHKQGDVAQLCYEVVGQKPQDIVYDLLVNYAFVDASFINMTDWNNEQLGYLPRLYNTLITSPTGVSKLLSELSEQVGFFLVWDEVESLIKFQTIRPNSPSETVTTLTSESHILADSLSLKDLVDERVNEAWVYYGIIDPTTNLSEESNFRNLYIASNVDDQSQLQNRDVRIKKIVSRWIIDRAAAEDLANRYLVRFAQAPIEAEFMLDAKDSNLKLCDFVQVESKQHQNYDGSPLAILLQIVKRIEKQTGTTWAFTARQFAFGTFNYSLRQVYIDGGYSDEYFNLNLKSAHDRRYDSSSLTSGMVVEFIITSGMVVSSASTSNYALTNPNTWPVGVTVRLIIESGAVVAGRGGDGGDGSEDGNGQDGGNGGRGMNILSALEVDNQGIIATGGGGGGGGAYGADGLLFGGGGGGGGGAPYGIGGTAAINKYEDIYGDLQTTPTNGTTATTANTTQSGGLGGRMSKDGNFGQGGNGGTGGAYNQNGTAASGNAGEDFGTNGTGGIAGDYAIVGIGFVTFINQGTILGATT